jgi:hypothetical protein
VPALPAVPVLIPRYVVAVPQSQSQSLSRPLEVVAGSPGIGRKTDAILGTDGCKVPEEETTAAFIAGAEVAASSPQQQQQQQEQMEQPRDSLALSSSCNSAVSNSPSLRGVYIANHLPLSELANDLSPLANSQSSVHSNHSINSGSDGNEEVLFHHHSSGKLVSRQPSRVQITGAEEADAGEWGQEHNLELDEDAGYEDDDSVYFEEETVPVLMYDSTLNANPLKQLTQREDSAESFSRFAASASPASGTGSAVGVSPELPLASAAISQKEEEEQLGVKMSSSLSICASTREETAEAQGALTSAASALALTPLVLPEQAAPAPAPAPAFAAGATARLCPVLTHTPADTFPTLVGYEKALFVQQIFTSLGAKNGRYLDFCRCYCFCCYLSF